MFRITSFATPLPQEELFLKFAEFEEKCKEPERARAIYRYALDNIPKGQVEEVFRRYTAFEKQHGDRDGIEDVIISKKRFQYEEEVQREPLNYDTWFDYARLEESSGDCDRVREVYERAISNVPPGSEKRFWQRYIYLWVNYALFEELEAGEEGRTREVYRACLKLIPHKTFTFAKIWILAAQFEIRCK
jgi:crooked neck